MSKEISIESLYANGMGIVYEDKPINTIKQESYPCSSIIDNSYISNSLEYLEYHSLIEKNNTKDMIKLNNRLYNTYGKYNKSLENYLINNANTSKENYNNYINTNKELYNELIMSRGTENYIIDYLISNVSNLFKGNPGQILKNDSLKNKVSVLNEELKDISTEMKKINKIFKDSKNLNKIKDIFDFNVKINIIVNPNQKFSNINIKDFLKEMKNSYIKNGKSDKIEYNGVNNPKNTEIVKLEITLDKSDNTLIGKVYNKFSMIVDILNNILKLAGIKHIKIHKINPKDKDLVADYGNIQDKKISFSLWADINLNKDYKEFFKDVKTIK